MRGVREFTKSHWSIGPGNLSTSRQYASLSAKVASGAIGGPGTVWPRSVRTFGIIENGCLIFGAAAVVADTMREMKLEMKT